jgi:hypothetical protein
VALYHYWQRSSFTWGPFTTQPISSVIDLGSVSAARETTDSVIRTRMWARFRYEVQPTTPPSPFGWSKLQIPVWGRWDPATSGSAGDAWPDGILGLLIGTQLEMKMHPTRQDLTGYVITAETPGFLDSFGQRKGPGGETFPSVTFGTQIFDPTGQTWPPPHFTQSLTMDVTAEVLWGSSSAG